MTQAPAKRPVPEMCAHYLTLARQERAEDNDASADRLTAAVVSCIVMASDPAMLALSVSKVIAREFLTELAANDEAQLPNDLPTCLQDWLTIASDELITPGGFGAPTEADVCNWLIAQ